MACTEYATLHTGAKMPLLGYGTWQSKEGELEVGLEEALRAGYRHIDTATLYENEDIIGKVVQEGWIGAGKLKREDLFIVTKLPAVGMNPGGPEKWLRRSLEQLRTDHVDVYLIHATLPMQEQGDNIRAVSPEGKLLVADNVDLLAVWKAMEAQVDAGRAKAIGVSNFNKRQIQLILDNCRIRPANLQVELHVYMQQKPLVDFCRKNGIVVTAYSPIGSPGAGPVMKRFGKDIKLPDLLNNPVVVDVARKHGKAPSQILLKHIVQHGIVAIPKSVSKERIAQNIQLFDFTLSAAEVAQLDALDLGKEGRIFDFLFPGFGKDHPVYAFNEYP